MKAEARLIEQPSPLETRLLDPAILHFKLQLNLVAAGWIF